MASETFSPGEVHAAALGAAVVKALHEAIEEAQRILEGSMSEAELEAAEAVWADADRAAAEMLDSEELVSVLMDAIMDVLRPEQAVASRRDQAIARAQEQLQRAGEEGIGPTGIEAIVTLADAWLRWGAFPPTAMSGNCHRDGT